MGKEQEQINNILGREQREVSTKQIVLLGFLILVVSTLVLFTHWPVLSAQALSADDNQYFIENQLVQKPGLSSAARFLTEVLEPSTVHGYYQPITMISLMVDFAITGQTDNLRPFHRTNLCLHIINTVLVIVLLYLLFGQVWVAAIAGLLFGIHPMTVEPIAWVSERKTLLAAFFTFWSLICYVRYTRSGTWLSYTACVVTFVLALMSKPTSTLLPLLLLLLDYWPLRRLNWRMLVEKVPLFIISGISAAITFISQTRTAGTVIMPSKYPVTTIPLVIFYNIRFYLQKIIWPVDLSVNYPFPKPLGLSHPEVFGGLVTSIILIVVLLLSLRHTRALLAGFLFFFVAMLPTMQIIGFSNVIAANKFAYLPSLGLLLPLTWFLSRFFNAPPRLLRRTIIVLAVIIISTGEVVAARSYLSHWKDTETLYSYMLTLNPEASELHLGLGGGLLEKGKIDEAIEAYREELRINPNNYKAVNNLATALARKGETTEAIEYFSKAVKLKPDDFKSHYNLAVMLSSEKKFEQAVGHFREAVRINPSSANAHYNLGALLLYKGEIDEAIEELQTALKIEPDFKQAQTQLEIARSRKFDKTNK